MKNLWTARMDSRTRIAHSLKCFRKLCGSWFDARAHFIIISADATAPRICIAYVWKCKSALCSGAIFFWHSLVLDAHHDDDDNWQQSMLEASIFLTTTRRLHFNGTEVVVHSLYSIQRTITMMFAMKPCHLHAFIKLLVWIERERETERVDAHSTVNGNGAW